MTSTDPNPPEHTGIPGTGPPGPGDFSCPVRSSTIAAHIIFMPSPTMPEKRPPARRHKIEWADAARARERISLLLDAGLTMDAIADMCAVHHSQMYAILNGRRGKPMTKVRASTLNALLAIRSKDISTYDLPASAKIPGDSARAQLQSLYCLGWSIDSLHEESGLAKSALRGLRDGDGTTEGFRLKVDALYRRLRGRTAPRTTDLDRIRYENALARAAASEWDEYGAEGAA